MAWFETWFDTPFYHILYKDRDMREAEHFISRLTDHLKLNENSKIIDLACGKGRHSVYLNKRGYRVLGLDLSANSIAHNKKFENENLKFSIHDMRREIYPEISPVRVEAVFNLFTSFGYFENEEDDRKVFQSVNHALQPNGFFVLDFLNLQWVKDKLVPHTETEAQGILFDIQKKIEGEYVIKDITFEHGGKAHHYYEKVKLHTLEQIGSYAADCGFEMMDVFGDYELNPYDRQRSPRCISVFRKEKETD